MIRTDNGKKRYFDRNGTEIVDGCHIKYQNGQVKKVYLTEEDELGTDATNPVWIARGKAEPCEYGIYPLTRDETDEVEVVAE